MAEGAVEVYTVGHSLEPGGADIAVAVEFGYVVGGVDDRSAGTAVVVGGERGIAVHAAEVCHTTAAGVKEVARSAAAPLSYAVSGRLSAACGSQHPDSAGAS